MFVCVCLLDKRGIGLLKERMKVRCRRVFCMECLVRDTSDGIQFKRAADPDFVVGVEPVLLISGHDGTRYGRRGLRSAGQAALGVDAGRNRWLARRVWLLAVSPG